MKGNVIVKKCSHNPSHIITMDGVDYFAADRQGATKFNGDIIINLTSTPNFPVVIPEDLKEHYDIPSEEIMVPWPDFGSPRLKMSFWETIHNVIKSREAQSVCIHCAHGHGRTGTALSCILVAMGGYSAIEAVDIVREYHCEEAVESQEQCFYILNVDHYYNNREIKEENYPMPAMMVNWIGTGNTLEDEDSAKQNTNMGVDEEEVRYKK
jgi:hypothetical protein